MTKIIEPTKCNTCISAGGGDCATCEPETPSQPACLCKQCKFESRCGFEGAKIREQNTPTCDDDCKHGRWYIDSTGKLLCDRICIHTIAGFICPFESNDTQIRNAMRLKIADDLEAIDDEGSWLALCRYIESLRSKEYHP